MQSILDDFASFINGYSPMSNAELDLVIPHIEVISAKKKEVIFGNNRICKHLYFIHRGLLRIYAHETENELTVGFLKDTDFFLDFECALSNVPSSINLECIEPTKFLILPYEKLLQAYEQSHAMERLGRLMVERAFKEHMRMNKFNKQLQPIERYEAFEKENPTLINRIPLKLLASFIGITPESLSRIRKRRMESLQMNS